MQCTRDGGKRNIDIAVLNESFMYFIQVDNRISVDERGHVIDVTHFQKALSPARLRKWVVDDAKLAFQAQNLSDSTFGAPSKFSYLRVSLSEMFAPYNHVLADFLGEMRRHR